MSMVSRDILRRWVEHPEIAYRDLFRDEPYAWQDEVYKAFSTKNKDPRARRIAMMACKNPGKTRVEAALGLIFLITRPRSKVGCLSITEGNLRRNLWSEMATLRDRSAFLKAATKFNSERITVNEAPAFWYAEAISYAKTADRNQMSDAMAGLHAPYILILLDETGGMAPAVLETAEAALGSGRESRIVMAGNCTSRNGALFHACVNNADKYRVFVITGDPDDPKRAPQVDIAWAKDMIERYGRNNPWVKANVLAEFPESEFNTLISEAQVREAMTRELEPHQFNWCEKRNGVDVAFIGGDITVLGPRQGLMWYDPIVVGLDPKSKTFSFDISARIQKLRESFKQRIDIVDATGGFGDGVVSTLAAAGETPFKYIGSSAATNPMFANKVTEVWWLAIDQIKNGASLPDCPEMIPELSMRTYTSTPAGKFLIEPKENYKKRLGRSPNFADAYAMTFALPDKPAENQLLKYMRSRHAQAEKKKYDPYARLRKKARR